MKYIIHGNWFIQEDIAYFAVNAELKIFVVGVECEFASIHAATPGEMKRVLRELDDFLTPAMIIRASIDNEIGKATYNYTCNKCVSIRLDRNSDIVPWFPSTPELLDKIEEMYNEHCEENRRTCVQAR